MALMQEIDYGTPSRVAQTLVTLEIDGKTSLFLREGTLGALGGAYQDTCELRTPGKVTCLVRV